MPVVTNKHSGPLALPGGLVLQPGASRDIPRWDTVRRNNTVAAWLRAKVLVVEPEGVTPGVDPSVVEADDQRLAPVDPVDGMTYLRAEAKALGINVDRRWGEKRLRAEIAKAES